MKTGFAKLNLKFKLNFYLFKIKKQDILWEWEDKISGIKTKTIYVNRKVYGRLILIVLICKITRASKAPI